VGNQPNSASKWECRVNARRVPAYDVIVRLA